jgi:hypothetical protein
MSAPTVLVGRKPVSSYVLACLHALQQNGSVEVRARGRGNTKGDRSGSAAEGGPREGPGGRERGHRDRAPSG